MKICIIGAGPSGIAAATRLIENGFTDLTILEAEMRIGGRVNTVPFGAGVVEVGAQWCHGIKNNAVYDLASKHNFLSEMALWKSSIPLYDTNGTLVPAAKSDKLFQLADRIMASEDLSSYKGSVGNFFMEQYWAALKDAKYDDIDAKLRNQFAKMYHQYNNAYEATDTWYLSSCHAEFEDESGPGENRIWNPTSRGYATVLDLLQKKIAGQGDPIEIAAYTQLNNEVKKITYNLNDSSIPIHIECTDGSFCDAEHLICTVSLGVLKKRHLNLFDPILPQKKIDTIECITYGVLDKILLEFERPFWPADWAGCVPLWNPEQLKLIRENEETRWLETVSGFHPIDNQPNVLLSWVAGPSARQMESLPAETVVKHMIMWLKMLLKDFEIPDAPKNYLRSQWYTNPHFCGSYSSISVETDAMNASNVELAEPLLNVDNKRPVIQFAGEATNHHHYSTVHGAIESGWREADRLIEFLKEKK